MFCAQALSERPAKTVCEQKIPYYQFNQTGISSITDMPLFGYPPPQNPSPSPPFLSARGDGFLPYEYKRIHLNALPGHSLPRICSESPKRLVFLPSLLHVAIYGPMR